MTDRAIALPFRVDRFGRIATTSDPATIGKQHVTTFLLTEPGERIMRPDFGSPVRESVFESLDSVTAGLLMQRVSEATEEYVTTARVTRLTSDPDSASGELRLTVEFALAVGMGEGVERSTTITLGGAE